jgi:hypothetical protein
MTSPTQTQDLVRQATPELDRFARLGQWLALLESGETSAKALGAANALRFYYAAELALPPTAVAEITVIHGRLFIGAQLMRALAEREGYRVKRVAGDDKACTAELHTDTGTFIGDFTYTIEMAQAAGLASKDNWKKNPARMLWARASTNVIRDYAPGVALGIGTTDEISEVIGEVIDEQDDVDWPDEPSEEQIAEARRLANEADDAARAEGEA